MSDVVKFHVTIAYMQYLDLALQQVVNFHQIFLLERAGG